jgi:hypothetical protein
MGEWELKNCDYTFSIVEKSSGRLICRCDNFKDKALLIIDAHNRAMRRISNVV